jgi:peptidoglycan/xylan/chitin deacetylase (PgdA/CDA1 family)
MGDVDMKEGKREIIECKNKIEAELEKKVDTFSFPFGRRSACREEVINILKENGFICSCFGYGGKVGTSADLFHLHRVPIYPNIIEMKMEIDNFHTYFDGKMYFGGKL